MYSISCIDKLMTKAKYHLRTYREPGKLRAWPEAGGSIGLQRAGGKAGRRVVLDDDRALGGGIRQIFCQAAVDAANKVVPQI